MITRDDSRQVASAESCIEKGAWVSVLALAGALIRAIEMPLNQTVAGARELFRAKPALGFSDCLMVESARKAGHLPLCTFDRNLAKVEGTQKR